MEFEFDAETAFAECEEPSSWAYMATALQKAASLMDWTEKRDITDWRYLPIYRMLMGFSMENLLKGILIAEGTEAIVEGKLNKALDGHGLKALSDRVSTIEISDREKEVLSTLEPYIYWAGRYPAPKVRKHVVRIGHSYALRDAELALGVKLYNHLRSLSPDIDELHATSAPERTEDDLP